MWWLLIWSATLAAVASEAAVPRLKVSANHHFLVFDDGTPFFWQADTAWELSMHLNRADMEKYLTRRHEQGFTVAYVVAFGVVDGVRATNANGHVAFVDGDPTKPLVKPGADNDFWDDLDAIVKKAESLGMFIGLLPCWGDAWSEGGGPFPVQQGPRLLNPENSRVYGEWMGKRYKDRAVVWIIGGDRFVDNDIQRETIRALARGLRAGDGGTHLITFHSATGSSQWFPNESWLDFNMWQTGHHLNYKDHYDKVLPDFWRLPPKPVVDGESIYEGHAPSFNSRENGHALAADIRRPVYWDLFQGAFGFTYGHAITWQMWTTNQPILEWEDAVYIPWQEAIDAPGANQMQFAKKLMLSRPFLTRIPDDSIIVPSLNTNSVPGGGRFRFEATRDEAGTYAMVYVPVGWKFQVQMDKIKGANVKAWWYDPRNGQATYIGTYSNEGVREFSPPTLGELLDYVLVLDDAAKNYPAPGSSIWEMGKN